MKISKNSSSPFKILPAPYPTLTSEKGNVLVYLVVVILIFGVLGVTIVSLFTSATTSSATPNDARRAYYLAESGVRYALSRIRNANFHPEFIKAINNTPKYTLKKQFTQEVERYFSIKVFSPWFISSTGQNFDEGDNPFNLSVPNAGEIPQNFSIPNNNVFLVHWQDFKVGTPTSYALITNSSTPPDVKDLTITLGDNLITNANDTTCLAVNCVINPHTIEEKPSVNSYLYIAEEAKDFFPSKNGAIRILKTDDSFYDYYYEKLEHDAAGNRVKLINLAEVPGAGWTDLSVTPSDYVVLSRYNFRVIATGVVKAADPSGDDVTKVIDDVRFFSDTGDWTITEREFIQDKVQKVTDDGVIKTQLGVSEDDDEIQLGEDVDTDEGFGNIWYGGDKPIGGDSNFCQSGRCLFGIGIRVFFTLDYSNDGEGFIFALLAAERFPTDSDPPINTSNSVGGDVERSELLGYAGDSREDPGGTSFLDGSLNGDGLLPPKMGVEFDTRTNFDSEFEQTLRYCNGASLNPDTRNDPQPGGNPEDAVQYVFWGSETIGIDPNPSITCRDDDATYDDNKHDAEDIFEKWQFVTGADVRSSPAVGDDGTIYVGSNDGHLYAVNPDGSQKWQFPDPGNIGAVESSPAIDNKGTPDDITDDVIYVGSDDNNLYAVNSDGTERWQFPSNTGADFKSSPAIGADGTIYIGDDDGIFYALSPAGVKKWEFTDPDLDIASRGRPAIGPALDVDLTGVRQRIYITGREAGARTLYALDPEDRQRDFDFNDKPFPNAPNEWIADLGGRSEFMPGVDDRPLPLGTTGTVYSDELGDELRAVGPGSTLGVGNPKWSSFVGTDIDSTPAVGEDGTIYFGGDSGHLFALEPANGLTDWRFPDVAAIGAVRTSPALGPDGTIYFGSDDNRLYALNPDVTSENDRNKFNFDTGDLVRSSPAVDPRDESVYVGSDSNRLHAFNQLAEPRNFRDDSVQDKKLVSAADFAIISNDWLLQGPWGVRMEVTYDGLVDGQEEYTLKTWVEKCTDTGCSKIMGSLFRNTLINYKVPGRPPKLEQTIRLSPTDHAKFERFLFGFTTAAATGDTQEAIIKFFELSFIRPSPIDETVESDPVLDPG